MTYPPPGTQYGTHAGPSTRPPPYYQDAFAAGTSSRPPPYYQDPFAAGSSRARPIDWGYGAGTTPEDSYGAAQAAPSPQGVVEQMAQSLFASPTQEELGYSQLHDAPPRATRRSRTGRRCTIVPLPDVRDSHATPSVTGHATLGLPGERHAGARGVVASVLS
ncbi:hypothetical protein U9M48_026613 [Paspalum notatum var. saurae]|uniref:Uncharacterized protein n=1 Tax=Paspalum notatum var. saurae TaxID=547442 RepID=A0AAQ3TT21_PASNO